MTKKSPVINRPAISFIADDLGPDRVSGFRVALQDRPSGSRKRERPGWFPKRYYSMVQAAQRVLVASKPLSSNSRNSQWTIIDWPSAQSVPPPGYQDL